MPRQRGGRRRGRAIWLSVTLGAVALLAVTLFVLNGHGNAKPVILYVNQGNGIVNGSGFGSMLSYASADGFNTVFFQVYRSGNLMFSPSVLRSFVNQTHLAHMKIFFALYITAPTQPLPASIYGLGEDGINLDMSSLDAASQQSYLSDLKSAYGGVTAVTALDPYTPLKPDVLVLETYTTGYRPFIKPGVVASVEVVATTDQSDYESQVQYALQNSDGVMVFDYSALARLGY